MACFAAPLAAGLLTSAFRRRIPGKYRIEWFNALVFGGSLGLAVEHLASGEIVLYPPFLTAMGSPADAAVMLSEIASIGVPMLIACAGVWASMVAIANWIEAASGKQQFQGA
jgi:LytS/YehU family sensor histidine kinase